ncbi:MAG: pentapeptide repeat-containing protein [Okeania sp. SIO2H7]|nr:pentapeptide repeat-containing protein [Okeania sp. SIO2H7]
MKAAELLKHYDAGRRDFRGENLRGQNFSGKDLMGADFSGADIWSTNFARAHLRGADFRDVRVGLRPGWAIAIVGSILGSFVFMKDVRQWAQPPGLWPSRFKIFVELKIGEVNVLSMGWGMFFRLPSEEGGEENAIDG